MPTIDLADFVVVSLVTTGSAYLIGYAVGRREKEETRRERVRLRRARRLELKHRAPEPVEDGQGTDTTVDVPAEDAPLTGYRRFADQAAGSSGSARRHFAEIRPDQFDRIVEGYGDVPDPDEAEPVIFKEVMALVMPTAEWLVLGRPANTVRRLTQVDGPDAERAEITRAIHAASAGGPTTGTGPTDDAHVPPQKLSDRDRAIRMRDIARMATAQKTANERVTAGA